MTAFKLAIATGEKKVSKVLKGLSSLDIALWQAYDNLFPFGQHHTDYLLAQLIALTFNANKGSEYPPISAKEVLGVYEPLTEEKVMAVMRSIH